MWILVVGLGGPGLLPAIAVARRLPVLIFLAPLIGAAIAAIAAEIELGVGGSLAACYAIFAVTVNAAVITWWLAAGRLRPRQSPPWGWFLLTVATMVCALIFPLTVMRAQFLGWDSNSIWLTHALLMSGGHHALLTGLQNPAYGFSNPDYPPLVPAVGALAFAGLGRGDLYVAPAVTVYLTACALGALGTGMAAAGGTRRLAHAVAVVGGGAICLVGFAVAAAHGVDGHADLLWGAAAAAAITWGLVLPRSIQALIVAWICAAVASLTKNEGLTTALIVISVIAFRYRPPRLPESRRGGSTAGHRSGGNMVRQLTRAWAVRVTMVVVPALPGLAWAGLIRHFGIHDAFFSASAQGLPASRARPTYDAMVSYLHIAPVAFAVLLAGSCVLRRDRKRAGFANPGWLWTAWLGSLAVIFSTYVFGSYPINWWLNTSASRTTTFAQLLLYADMTIWAIIASEAAIARTDSPSPHRQTARYSLSTRF